MANGKILTPSPYVTEAITLELKKVDKELYFGGFGDSPYIIELNEKKKALEKALFELTSNVAY